MMTTTNLTATQFGAMIEANRLNILKPDRRDADQFGEYDQWNVPGATLNRFAPNAYGGQRGQTASFWMEDAE